MTTKIFSGALLVVMLLIMNLATAAPEVKVFDITGVKQSGTLNMRAWPNTKATVLIAIPYNTQWIAYMGKTQKQGNTSWKKVHWNGKTGWVNDKFLKYDAAKTAKVIERRNHRLKQNNTISRNNPRTAPKKTISKTVANKPANPNQKQVVLACGGNSPYWNMHMNLTSKKIDVDLQNGTSFTSPLYYRKWTQGKNEMRINGGKGRNIVQATLNKTNACKDGLTNIKYPFTINANIGQGKKVSGCCRTIQR